MTIRWKAFWLVSLPMRISGDAVLRGEKAPDDALARELGAMGLL